MNEIIVESRVKRANAPKPNIRPAAPHHLLPPREEENILRRSLKGIGEDMKKMEDLITLTEDIIRRERERDREFYLRERRRKLSANPSIPRHLFQIQKIEPRESQPVQNAEVPLNKTPSSEHMKEVKSPLSLRKKLTKRFRRKSMKKSDNPQSENNQEDPANRVTSPTLKIHSTKPNRKISIRFSPRRYRSRLYFRNGKIGCIDAENVSANQTNIEKTHAIVNYITSELDSNNANAKRSSLTSNISDILSEQSSESLNDLPNSNSYFNFDYSPTESDDRGIADDDFYMNSLSDIDSFTVHPKSDEELAALADETTETIEGAIQQSPSVDEEMGNDPNSIMPTFASDSAMVDFIDEATTKNVPETEDKPPNSAMSNHSNVT